MSKRESKDHWALVGKTSVVIGILVGLGTLWNHIKPSEQRISAQCTPYAMEIPPDIQTVFEKIRESQSRDNISTVIKSAKIRNLSEYEILELANAISDNYYKTIPSGYKYSLPSYTSYYEVIVTNNGSVAVDDATIIFPFDAIALVTSPEEAKKAEFAKKSLAIGNIRPKGKIRTQLWTTSGYSFINEDNFIVYFKGGSASIKFPYTVWGFFGWLDKYWFMLIFLGFLLAFGAITTIPLVIKNFKNMSGQIPQTTQEPESETAVGAESRPPAEQEIHTDRENA